MTAAVRSLFASLINPQGTWAERTVRGLIAVTVLIVAYAVLGPLGIALPGMNLDPSWKEVLGEAAELHLAFGTNIAFTSGPLAAIYTRYYPAQDFWRLLPFFLIVIGGLARFAWLCTPSGTCRAALLAALVFAIWRRDAILLTLPLLVALASSDERVGWRSLLLGLAAIAAAGLAKFSILILALPLLLLADLERAARRRPPILSAIWIALSCLFFWCLAGGFRAFFGFLYYSWQLSAGYTEAMQLSGNPTTRLAFLVLAGLLLLTALIAETSAVFRKKQRATAAAVKLSAIFLFLFVLWKTGFVRQPDHDWIAFAGLPIVYAAYAGVAAGRRSDRFGIDSALAVAAIILVALFVPAGLLQPPVPQLSDRVDTLSSAPARALGEFRRLIDFARGPQAYLAQAARRQEEGWTQIRLTTRLPPISGTVDIIPSVQSLLLARHLAYRPMINVQEYASYTHALIEATREIWFGPRGPNNIIFGFTPAALGFTPIDDRLPALSEGPIWPDLLRFYAPGEIEDPLLLLRRRSTPLPDLLSTAEWQRARLEDWVSLPHDGRPIFLSIALSQTLAGRALSLFYKPGLIFIETETSDGRRSRFRLVPGIARDGFVISPEVTTTSGFRDLACGQLRPLDQIRIFRIVAQSGSAASYRAAYQYRAQEIDTSPLLEACLSIQR